LYLLRETNFDSVFFYVNKPSIVTGRLQVPFAEINCVNLYSKGIPLYRRHSGGGTVFHDPGNLNFAFITGLNSKRNNYLYFNSKIIDVLNSLGVPDLENKENNIFCKTHKISGTAQYKYKNRLLHHGTLLINCNLQEISVLLKSSAFYSSLAVKSRHSKVENISQYFEKGLSTNEIMLRIIDNLIEEDKIEPMIGVGLMDFDILKYKEHLLSDDWIYYSSPFYRFKKEFLFRSASYTTSFEVSKGKIKSFRIEGSGLLRHLNLDNFFHTFNDVFSELKKRYSEQISNDESQFLLTQFI
jgi:lipoate-protein ligase A